MTDLPYRAIWERELRAGLYGQDRMKPSTWRMDGLYRAVCYQARAEEMERTIADALRDGIHEDSVEGLLAELDDDIAMAHHVFTEWEKAHGAEPAA